MQVTGANYKMNQIKISWNRKMSVPYPAAHVLNSWVDTSEDRKYYVWLFMKQIHIIFRWDLLKNIWHSQIWKNSEVHKAVRVSSISVYPALVRHHSRKNELTVSLQIKPPLYGTAVLVTYVFTSSRVKLSEISEIKESIAFLRDSQHTLSLTGVHYD